MTKPNHYCERCGPVENTHVEKRSETYPVKGEPTEILANVLICDTCGQDAYDRELDSANLEAAYDAFRRSHHLISPEDLRTMRECYGLSQRSLGMLLGWGEVTIHRYESGSLPDDAHNQVLRLIQDPFNMEFIVEENGQQLNPSTLLKLQSSLSSLLRNRASDKVAKILAQSSSHKKADEYTGYLAFQPEVLIEMMVYFASRASGVLKTKLNKLLWYSDFFHFKFHAVSISGATYLHYPYGPVPERYDVFLGSLYEGRILISKEVDFGNDFVGEEISAQREVQDHLLPRTAVDVMSAVYTRFRSVGSTEISNISHQELGYEHTAPLEPISYKYADDLKVSIPISK